MAGLIHTYFPVSIDKSGAEFIAWFPDIFGANARGSSPARALAGAAEALALVLYEMREDGLEFPRAGPIPDGGTAILAPIVWR